MSSIDELIQKIEKKHGTGSVMLLGQAVSDLVPVIPTGSLTLDIALGVGGVPRGRITEIFGPYQSGKTTICLSIAAQCQKMGGKVAYVDVEHALDSAWAKLIGVDVGSLVISQPEYAEQALDIMQILAESGEIDLIVLDSVASLLPKAELEGEMGDSHMALTARLMSQAMRKLTPILSNTRCAAIFTNQLRQKIGVVYGSPETTTGGEALKYYSSVRLDVRKRQDIKSANDIIGNEIRVTVKKNKVAPPFLACDLAILYDRGLHKAYELVELSIFCGLAEKTGAWLTFFSGTPDEIKLNGHSKAVELVDKDSAFADVLEHKLRLRNGLPVLASYGN